MRRLVFPTAPSPTVTHLMNLVVVMLGVLTATFVLLFISESKVHTKNILSQINMNYFELVGRFSLKGKKSLDRKLKRC